MKVGTDGVLLGAWADVANANSILDVGTGSGLIALMLAQRTGNHVRIDAVELVEQDVRRASLNVAASPWAHRVRVYHSPIQDFSGTLPYDLIVSNPPFFANSLHSPYAQRNVARHDDQLTVPELMAAVERLLAPNGVFVVILPVAEAGRFQAHANRRGFYCKVRCAVFSQQGKSQYRWLLVFARGASKCDVEQLVLFEGPEKTKEYAQLTADFYLDERIKTSWASKE